MTSKSFQCESRVEKFIRDWMSQGRDYPPEERLAPLIERCNNPQEYTFGKVTYRKCLCKFKHPEFGFYMTLYSGYKGGMLPVEGGMIDQPAKLIEAIQYIQGLDNERQEAEMKAAQQQRSRAPRKR